MHTADFNQLSEAEKRHFYKCGRCGEMVEIVQRRVPELRGSRPERPVDCRYQLPADDEIDHAPRP